MISPRRAALAPLALFVIAGCAAPDGADAGLGEAQQALNDVCPGASVPGIDIASFQHPNGAGIDWGQVASAEKFVIVKATESNDYVNSYYAGDVAGARGAGLPVGSYHFLAPSSQTGVSGAAQAQYFLAHASIQSGDLPPMLDVETSSLYGSVLPSAADVDGWLTTVQSATGMKPIVYIGYYVIQDLGTPPELANYWINVPNYSTCPSYPDGWPTQNLVMWQHTSTAHVPGISGNVDEDLFYGDESALQQFVHPDQAATGYLDHAGCDTVNGWGWDPDDKTSSTHVDVYYDGPAGGAGVTGVRTDANRSRDDLCSALGSCDHAFSMRTPRSLFDGAPHDVHAYAIDLNGTENGELHESPRTIQCAPLDLPAGTVKRWVTDPTVFSAWQFDDFLDVAHVDQSKVDAEPTGAKIDAPPACVQADDGTPEVWVIDQGLRRHVIDPDALAAWRFSVTKTPAADVYAHAVGPDWPATPDLVQGSEPNVYVLDVPLGGDGGGGATGTGGGHGHGSGAGSGTGSGPGAGVGGSGGASADGDTAGGDSGCSASGHASQGGAWLAFAAVAAAAGSVRRRRRRRA
ncbi:MAG TPA: glycoside hydrolase family 25 protein [Minicystis sp.]|nr:glycoside hydrolase family 25 protein [Minicystis sp.]